MRIVALSDTHWRYPDVRVPDGDVLVFAGDFCGRGNAAEVGPFSKWFNSHPHPAKVLVPGNHDWPLQGRCRGTITKARYFPEAAVLNDSGRFIGGVSFYGHPHTPRFFDWAFNIARNSPELHDKHLAIPTGVDVLVTHGAPYGFGDVTPDGRHVGDELLAEELERIQPKVHIFGHIHHGYGAYRMGGSALFNVCVCNESYSPVNAPVVIDL